MDCQEGKVRLTSLLLQIEYAKPLFCFGMGIPAVTGNTAYGRYGLPPVVLIKIKKLFIDFCCHKHHVPGNILLLFLIACKIEVMVRSILIRGMTKVAFYPQSRFKTIHHFIQIIMADILRENLQVFIFWGVLRCGSRYTCRNKT